MSFKKLTIESIQELILDVPDFPKAGITFKDITPVLSNGEAFQSITQHFSDAIPDGTTKLVAVESRGFIFGSAIAHHLGIGMVLVRKPGKLPRETYSHSYALEYGEDTLEVHKADLTVEDRVVVIDDVLATGGTAQAVEKLCAMTGAKILGHRFLMEIEFLKGREKLSSDVQSFIYC